MTWGAAHLSLQVMVVVAYSDSFSFVYPDYFTQEDALPGPSVRRLTVTSQSGATVLVPVRPLLIGLMPISVKIQSTAGAQRLHKMVMVKVRERKTQRDREEEKEV